MDDARWWQRATGYQIYPRSFQDSDGDGVGDIPGIVSRLDHLADLGVGFVWLSPVYASPMADNGYDVSDYRAIAPQFGTMADFDRLVDAARARGIGIVMDLVVNHSSNEHAWFRAARASRAAPEHQYYIWRDAGPDGGPPDDRRAAFGGPAWSWVEEIGQYYLHLFSPQQPDLNWRNPALRSEIHDMMDWWIAKGIAGFRMDVIDLIGKDVDAGLYEEGPYLHDYLREMHARVLKGRDLVTVGESWSVSLDTALLYCGRDRGELDMLFQFNHIRESWDETLGKFSPLPFDLVAFKKVMNDWQALMNRDGWNSLFLSNHDLPRQVSKYGQDGEWRVRSAKLLATVMHLMKGTPFVYQGEEIGMTNVPFDRIDQFRDLETLNAYAEQTEAGVATADFLRGARANGRDNARTPMQWTDGPQAGFTDGTPWIEVNPNHGAINVAADRADPDGIIAHYRRLIALRRDSDLVVFGTYRPFAEDHPQVMAYDRRLGDRRLAVLANFGSDPVRFDVPDAMAIRGRCAIANAGPREALEGTVTLAPWEAVAVAD
ncbi:oligosaccharide alpha-1,6-glucosidase protein [Oceaniovalibus guishaninsula JLT2003]|uniref:Oligosaccharide alpha-1,6-glucosidase protein n=1 Tax=Oceaniovalibus guishaninsula JLT2003 TaxID=1231392 RepID=K2I4V6_9RHOB|nr:alpha-glucosidase [Oceaniovalibus guishaninsula]EKE43960.1 oligosaccharide alpha-1,6-glucosidase protein [Oceaniovalibus guishaninsula JLT2003]